MENNNVREITVSYKRKKRTSPSNTIVNSKDAYKIFKDVYKDFIDHHEECWVMYLNNARDVIGVSQISKGGFAGTVIDIRIVLQIALKTSATAIMISHNHPSGLMVASSDDILFTEKLRKACIAIDINLLDHLILTSEGFMSIM